MDGHADLYPPNMFVDSEFIFIKDPRMLKLNSMSILTVTCRYCRYFEGFPQSQLLFYSMRSLTHVTTKFFSNPQKLGTGIILQVICKHELPD